MHLSRAFVLHLPNSKGSFFFFGRAILSPTLFKTFSYFLQSSFISLAKERGGDSLLCRLWPRRDRLAGFQQPKGLKANETGLSNPGNRFVTDFPPGRWIRREFVIFNLHRGPTECSRHRRCLNWYAVSFASRVEDEREKDEGGDWLPLSLSLSLSLSVCKSKFEFAENFRIQKEYATLVSL